jgi:hypothetical protein
VNLFLKEVTENKKSKMPEEKRKTTKTTTTTSCLPKKKKAITNRHLKNNHNQRDRLACRTTSQNNKIPQREVGGKGTCLTQVNKCCNH